MIAVAILYACLTLVNLMCVALCYAAWVGAQKLYTEYFKELAQQRRAKDPPSHD